MNSSHDILVLGGGIAGISAFNRLRQKGLKSSIIERSVSLGGLTRSIYVDRYVFDYTGHFLHLAQLSHPNELGFKQDSLWQKMERKAYCFYKGHFLQAPFQYHLGQLPEEIKNFCVESYLTALNKKNYTKDALPGEDLLSYFYRTSGEGITDIFLKPYNEKIFATSLDVLSAQSINRFFPAPNKDLIENGAKSSEFQKSQGYNSLFWYPKYNGIQQLVDTMVADPVVYKEEVEKIDLHNKIVTTSAGEFSYNKIFSSLPLDEVARISSSNHETNESLSYASVVTFQIGVKEKIPDVLKDKHWIYLSDPSIAFHRVGIYSNFNSVMAPTNAYNLYIEVGHKEGSSLDLVKLEKQVLTDLHNLGWLKIENIEVLLRHTIKHGYVHFNHAWQKEVPTLLDTLENHDFYSIGRYGRWNYISMEDGIVGAWESVDRMYRKELLQQAS